jgi:RNA polymerase sigma-70 factor, ECF subfamily
VTPRESTERRADVARDDAAGSAPPRAGGRDAVHDPVEPEPFDVFFRRELRPLIGLAYALSGSRVAAEDIAQEALAAASRRWDEIGRLEHPGGWVRRVVANRSVSLIRRRVNEARGHARLALRRDVAVVPELPSDTDHLWALVRRLPRRQAQVVTLRALDTLSLQEIASILGLTKESVHTHLKRARHTLSRQIDTGAA